MATEFILPGLGENIEEGDITRVFVKVGDTLAKDQSVLEMETGKATLEVPSTVSGTVTKILVAEGEKAKVGQPILLVEGGDATPAPVEKAAEPETSKPSTKPPTPSPEPTPIQPSTISSKPRLVTLNVPGLGENIEQGDVTSVLVKVGDTIEADQGVIEMETGKATIEIPSEFGGVVKSMSAKEGEKLNVGDPILELETTESAQAAPVATPTQPPTAAAPAAAPKAASASAGAPAIAPLTGPTKGPAAPSVRKFAREIGIDIGNVPGSGARGRVSIPDVKAYSRNLNAGRVATAAAPSAPPLPDFSKWGEVEREAMNNVRKMTVKHMTTCWTTIPHVTQNDSADITELEALRKRFKEKIQKAGGKLTPTVLLLKIVASMLKAHPKLNASIDTEANEIILKKYINIGIAVDTPKGLLVPVIRDADKKSLIELAVELTEVAGRVREGKISPNDMQGGSFTITNLGGIGGGHFTPIVNHPEVAILGVGRAKIEPVYMDGAFQPRQVMPLSLSYDHRLVDGADGARFITAITEAIEEPLTLAMDN